MTSRLRRAAARTFWRVSRWELRSQPQRDVPRILIGAPHTSNWDFVLMLAIAWEADIPLRWLGKKSLFVGPAGPVMRALGGIAVDRSDPSRIVAEVLHEQATTGAFSLVVTPEGTRGGAEYWKSGFYRIAREADLPVTLGYVDRTTMTAGLGPTLDLTGDVSADMDRVRAFYADKSGFAPSRRIEPRLRSETPTDPETP
ncbi:acyl-phosphate glycerol 3-phosphate acyltransferase [Serinibacter arcticus]|uniref:Acyl-phosphate glycerol 3-phosphate acyltransferase n=1 Tax=Serinibacter arcticus TaxID=1655435 RepID=A0A2U1ZUW7_9MICO|nr:1-acyl-sn-glycerol-3-phosphate acyltransferase [Serinibacter arcticus]PWD50768.1 acyl-phosphate glycerol 3-phosphate acyltransferase [Serinibacter arcticus]